MISISFGPLWFHFAIRGTKEAKKRKERGDFEWAEPGQGRKKNITHTHIHIHIFIKHIHKIIHKYIHEIRVAPSPFFPLSPPLFITEFLHSDFPTHRDCVSHFRCPAQAHCRDSCADSAPVGSSSATATAAEVEAATILMPWLICCRSRSCSVRCGVPLALRRWYR